jgi:hypothetical protein
MLVLGFFYICLRNAFVSFRDLPPPPPPGSMNDTGLGIDAGKFSGRLQRLREELQAGKAPVHTDHFKRALRVEDARERLARLAFFEAKAPTPPPTSGPDESLHLMLI